MPLTQQKPSGSTALSGLPGLVRRNHRRARPLAWMVAGLLLAGAGWVLVTGYQARGELLAAKADLETVRNSVAGPARPAGAAADHTKSRDRAAAAARSAAGHADRAHRLTTGPAWYMAARLPFLGAPLETVRGTAKTVDRLAGDVLPAVVRTAGELTAAATADGRHLNLAALREAAPDLDRAAHQVSTALTETRATPEDTWLSPVDQARAQLLGGLEKLTPAVKNTALGARLLPSMLGEDGPRRYLLVFQNPAEARGTGGLPGAYAVLRADRGELALTEFGRDTDMQGARPKVDLGAEFAALYQRADSVNTWPNSNMSPHFPYAARIWSAAWQNKSGKRVDGVLSLDPSVLSRLLAAAGPAKTADGTVITAGNVVDLSERVNYVLYPDPVKRKAFLMDVARAAAERLLTAAEDPARRTALLLGLYEVVADGRMTAWSAAADEQKALETLPVGGSLPQDPEPYAGLVVNNAAGTKLDYYLDRSLDWRPGRCTPDGREVTVKAVLTNRAPSSGLPSYVTARLDKPRHGTRHGDNRLLVSYFATAGARLAEATVDGRRTMLSRGTERGHPVWTFDIELPAGTSRTLTLRLLDPAASHTPTVFHQQLPRPLRATVHPVEPCTEERP